MDEDSEVDKENGISLNGSVQGEVVGRGDAGIARSDSEVGENVSILVIPTQVGRRVVQSFIWRKIGILKQYFL